MLDSMPPFRFKYWIHDNSNHVNKQAPTCTGWSRPGRQAADQDRHQTLHGPDGSTFLSDFSRMDVGLWPLEQADAHRDQFPPGLKSQRASELPPPLAPPTGRVTLDVRCGACDSPRRLYYQRKIAISVTLFFFFFFF